MVKGTNLKTDNKGGGCWIHNSVSHDTTDCYKFKSLNSKDKFELVKSWHML